MKALIYIVLASGFAFTGAGQGTVIFNNRVVPYVVTHVYAPNTSNITLGQIGNGTNDLASGTTSWAGYALIGANGTGGQFGAATVFAQLLGAPGVDQPFSSLVPASPVATFRTGPAAGFVGGGLAVASLQNVPPDAPAATVMMVAWDNSSGLYPTWSEAYPAWIQNNIAAGESNPLNLLQIGGGLNNPPYLTGLQSFNLYNRAPEPTTLVLAALGAAILVFCRRRRKY
jgi:hypothetical protein